MLGDAGAILGDSPSRGVDILAIHLYYHAEAVANWHLAASLHCWQQHQGSPLGNAHYQELLTKAIIDDCIYCSTNKPH